MRLNWDGPVAGMPGAYIESVTSLPDGLPGAERAGLYAEAVPGRMLQRVPGVARFLARDGKSIEVAAEADADPTAVRVFLDGIMRAALVYQRGELPLHAATLTAPGSARAVAICGPSGIGKSTLAAALSRRRWLLLADDNSRVTPGDDHVLAWPCNTALKLWRDACEAGGVDPAGLDRLRPQMEKFIVPVNAQPEAARLSLIVELSQSGTAVLKDVGGAARLSLLSENSYRPRLIRPMGAMTAHMKIVSAVSQSTRICRLGGARETPVTELADRIAEALA